MTEHDRPIGIPGYADGTQTGEVLAKLATGIPGFDHVTMGGLPRGRATLVTGTSGSAKTVFAVQFLAEGIARGQNAVFVTFEEPAEDIRRNMLTLGWDIEAWERGGSSTHRR
jgi:circadian clock protein KaiC